MSLKMVRWLLAKLFNYLYPYYRFIKICIIHCVLSLLLSLSTFLLRPACLLVYKLLSFLFLGLLLSPWWCVYYYLDDDHEWFLGGTVDEADGDTASHLIVWKLPYCCDSDQTSCPLKMLASEMEAKQPCATPPPTPNDDTTPSQSQDAVVKHEDSTMEIDNTISNQPYPHHENETVVTDPASNNNLPLNTSNSDVVALDEINDNVKTKVPELDSNQTNSQQETENSQGETPASVGEPTSLYLDTNSSNCGNAANEASSISTDNAS